MDTKTMLIGGAVLLFAYSFMNGGAKVDTATLSTQTSSTGELTKQLFNGFLDSVSKQGAGNALCQENYGEGYSYFKDDDYDRKGANPRSFVCSNAVNPASRLPVDTHGQTAITKKLASSLLINRLNQLNNHK